MKVNTYFKIGIFCVALSVFTLNAQNMRLFTAEQGLISSHINQIEQDNNGFLWITTEYGLSRFDGSHFISYQYEPSNPYSINTYYVHTIYQDKKDQYWVGSMAGLFRFDMDENRFTHVRISSVEDRGIPVSVTWILPNPMNENELIIGSQGYGINVYDTEKDTVNTQLNYRINQNGYIEAMMIDSDSCLWIIRTMTGLSVFDMKTLQYLTLPGSELLQGSSVNQLIEDKKTGDILFGTDKKGLLLYDKKQGKFRQVKDDHLRTMEIKTVYQCRDGSILIGAENEGLWCYDRDTEAATPYLVYNSPINLKVSKVHDITEDIQGNIWLGIYQKGLFQLSKTMNNFDYYAVSAYPDEKNVACNTSIFRDDDGRLWVATDGGGIFIIQGEERIHLSKANTPLETNSIMCLQKDKAGCIWIGTYGSGLYCYRNGRLQRPEECRLIAQERIMSMAYDEERNLLYIGSLGGGLISYDLNTKGIYYESININRWIFSLFLDTDNLLWIGSSVQISCYDTYKKELMYQSLLDPYVTTAYSFTESQRYIWAATTVGLLEFDRESLQCYLYTVKDGLPEDRISSVFCGENDRLWMVTSYAIASMNLYNHQIEKFQTYDDLQVGEFRYASICRDGDRLILGGDNGLVSFYPTILDKKYGRLIGLSFDRLLVNDTEVRYFPAPNQKNILDAAISSAKSITLSHQDNSFILYFSAQEFSNPTKVHYQYRLEGYENEWHDTDIRNAKAAYFNIPAGKYTLVLKAYMDDVDHAAVRKMAIHVTAPWFFNIWAKLCYLLIGISLILVLLNYALTKRRNHKQWQLLKQEEEMKEAKLKLFTSISHEIRTPLTLILSPLKTLLDKENNETLKGLYELMERNANRILLLINQLMDVRKIENGQLRLYFEEVDLQEMIKNIMLSFSNLATIRRITFSLELMESSSIKIWCDPLHFDKIFFNLLSNAFKYTTNEGKVLIRIACFDNKGQFKDPHINEYVEIRVYNSASSIENQDIDLIFERFYQGKNSHGKTGSGIGLNLTKQLVELHHGSIEARNIEDNGVEFIVRMPLGNAHLSDAELQQREPVQEMKQEEEVEQPKADVPTLLPIPDSGTDMEDVISHNDKQRTIFVVDDDKEFCAYIKNELTDFHVIVSYGGTDAWKQIVSCMPDVVVTDLIMPDGDGYELCNRIKTNPDTDHIPVIVLTSEMAEKTQEKVMNCMADRYLNKPLNIALLRGAIGQALRIRENILNKMHRTEMGYEYDQVKVDSYDVNLVKRVVKAIRDHMGDSDFNVEELSAEVGISRVHLNRKLKENIGMSPSTLLRTIRLKQAAYLLANNKVNIAEVSYMVGFANPSYFSNIFGSYFGMTPKEFVLNYMENPDKDQLKNLLDDSFRQMDNYEE